MIGGEVTMVGLREMLMRLSERRGAAFVTDGTGREMDRQRVFLVPAHGLG